MCVETIGYRLRNVISEKLNMSVSVIKNESTFIEDLEMDSLDTVELTIAVETEFGIKISDDNAAQMLTIQDVIDAIMQRLSEKNRGGVK